VQNNLIGLDSTGTIGRGNGAGRFRLIGGGDL
jgi:hypothetical protein